MDTRPMGMGRDNFHNHFGCLLSSPGVTALHVMRDLELVGKRVTMEHDDVGDILKNMSYGWLYACQITQKTAFDTIFADIQEVLTQPLHKFVSLLFHWAVIWGEPSELKRNISYIEAFMPRTKEFLVLERYNVPGERGIQRTRGRATLQMSLQQIDRAIMDPVYERLLPGMRGILRDAGIPSYFMPVKAFVIRGTEHTYGRTCLYIGAASTDCPPALIGLFRRYNSCTAPDLRCGLIFCKDEPTLPGGDAVF